MSARVICISRALAAGGETIGQLVSARLGFHYVDEEIITLAADAARVDPALVAKAEHRKSILTRLLDAIADRSLRHQALPAAPSSYFSPSTSPPSSKSSAKGHDTASSLANLTRDAKALIREAIVEVASRGQVVIVAHAASFALGGVDGVLRVLVTASEKTRVRRIWLKGKLLSEAEASAAVTESDVARRDYLRDFYDVAQEQPTDYDLVINTDFLEPEQAASCVIAAVNG